MSFAASPRLVVVLVLGALALALSLPSPSQAAVFVVNENSDALDEDVGDGRCDQDEGTPGLQCSLRAALAEANEDANRDRIEFDPAVFDGTHPNSTIVADGTDPNPLSIGSELFLDGGDCKTPTSVHRPCVGIDAADHQASLHVGADDVRIRGLALHGADLPGADAGLLATGADGLIVHNTWLGVQVGGFNLGTASDFGILLTTGAAADDTDRARIGGKTPAKANVFQAGIAGLELTGADRTRVRGNFFNTAATGFDLGQAGSAIRIQADGDGNAAVANDIGTRLTRDAHVSPECDGGCNVISNSAEIGVLLLGSGTEAPRDTMIRGNFIGLHPSGTIARENTNFGVALGRSRGTQLGGGGRERNHITGGVGAIVGDDGPPGLQVKSNHIGLDSSGQESLDPPVGGGAGIASEIESVAGAPAVIANNRFAVAPSSTALGVYGEGAVVIRNVFGIARDGSAIDDPPPSNAKALRVHASDSVIGKRGAGNVIGDLSAVNLPTLDIVHAGIPGGDSNRIQGNMIGVDASGVAHPIEGDGVAIQGDAFGNTIGGGSRDAENVLSNISRWPILVDDNSSGGPDANRIRRNRGKGNGTGLSGDMFINLRGADGFGNGDPSIHGGIEAPTIDDATRRRAEGTDANPGALIYVFQTADPAGISPTRIDRFLGKAVADGTGEWQVLFDAIPAGRRVTALQLDPDDGSSELALAVEP